MVGPSRFESDTHRFRWYYTLLSACKSALAKLVLLPSFILNLWNGFTLVARRHGNWLEIADCFLSGFWELRSFAFDKRLAARLDDQSPLPGHHRPCRGSRAIEHLRAGPLYEPLGSGARDENRLQRQGSGHLCQGGAGGCARRGYRRSIRTAP